MDQDRERELLLTHARHPLRVGEITDSHGRGQCHNPLCGDKIAVSFTASEGMIKSIRILPSGCSISLASASLMTELVEGRTFFEVETFIEKVYESFSLMNNKGDWPESLHLLMPLKRIRENPLKIPCVLISWQALKGALKAYQGSTKH